MTLHAPILGEAVTSAQIGVWLGCLAAMALLANQLFKLLDRFKENPPPRDTYQLKGDYAARSELMRLEEKLDDLADGIRADVDKIRGEMKIDRDAMTKAAEERARYLNEQINDVLKAVSALGGVVDRMREETRTWAKPK